MSVMATRQNFEQTSSKELKPVRKKSVLKTKKLSKFIENRLGKIRARSKPPMMSQINDIPIDRLNDLPDSLLNHILSFLRVKEAAATCVLSKRWQFLWPNVPNLEFWESQNENEDPNIPYWFVPLKKTRRFVAWVNRVLAVRTVNSVDKFSLRMRYDQFYAADIDKWISYAVFKRVKKLILLIHSCYITDTYKLPNVIYSCSSLNSLLIQGHLVMDTPLDKINWNSLTELYLQYVELDQELVDAILSTGCPVLNRFEIKACLGYHRLETKSRNLHTLVVVDSEDENVIRMEIRAPCIQFLDISCYLDGRLLEIDIQSLYKVRVNFNLHGWVDPAGLNNEANEFLQCFQHVEKLELTHKCFEVISMLAATGLQLPQSSRRYLEISSSRAYMYNVSGIVALLESSPDLEILVVEGLDTNANYEFLDLAVKKELDCDLWRLKCCYIRNFSDPDGEPMLMLARIMLKRAPILEIMEVVIDAVESRDFIRIHQELQLLPRASTKVEVVIKQQ